jgi:hypothetical protein
MRHILVAFGLLCLGAPSARAAEKCKAHQHESVSKDEDQGAIVKRCVCDTGWDAAGPEAPCKKVKPGTTKPKAE